jgi:hypothetical protein
LAVVIEVSNSSAVSFLEIEPDLNMQVEAFLKAHGADDEGLKGEQKKVAAGMWQATTGEGHANHTSDLLSAEPMRG